MDPSHDIVSAAKLLTNFNLATFTITFHHSDVIRQPDEKLDRLPRITLLVFQTGVAAHFTRAATRS